MAHVASTGVVTLIYWRNLIPLEREITKLHAHGVGVVLIPGNDRLAIERIIHRGVFQDNEAGIRDSTPGLNTDLHGQKLSG